MDRVTQKVGKQKRSHPVECSAQKHWYQRLDDIDKARKTEEGGQTTFSVARNRHQVLSMRTKSRVDSLPGDEAVGTVQIRHAPRSTISWVLLRRDVHQEKMQIMGIGELKKGFKVIGNSLRP